MNADRTETSLTATHYGKEEAAGGPAAGGGAGLALGGALDQPHDTTERGNGQDPAGGDGTQPELDYVEVAFNYACEIMDDLALGLNEVAGQSWKQYNRVRTTHLTPKDSQLLSILIAQESHRRPAGIRAQIGNIFQLETHYDELTELAAEVGALDLHKTEWTADELLAVQFPEPNWAIEGILPEGLAILAGRPKLGKSWLALQWALSIGAGGMAFGRKVKKGKVFYLALEDHPRRLQNRQKKQNWQPGADVTFVTAWKDLLDGGLDELRARIERDTYALVVIDTLSRAMRFDQNEVDRATAVLAPLQKLALERGCCILLVDHHKKSAFSVDDVIDEVLGSTGKTAVADVILGLFRERGKTGATLKVAGRDLEDVELVIEWDRVTCAWQLLGDAKNTPRTDMEQAVLAAIKTLGGEATTKQIAEYLEKDAGQVSRAIGDLLERRILIRGERSGKEVPYQVNPIN